MLLSYEMFNLSIALKAEDVPLANGAMSFNRVCREWRCKFTGDKSGKCCKFIVVISNVEFQDTTTYQHPHLTFESSIRL